MTERRISVPDYRERFARFVAALERLVTFAAIYVDRDGTGREGDDDHGVVIARARISKAPWSL